MIRVADGEPGMRATDDKLGRRAADSEPGTRTIAGQPAMGDAGSNESNEGAAYGARTSAAGNETGKSELTMRQTSLRQAMRPGDM